MPEFYRLYHEPTDTALKLESVFVHLGKWKSHSLHQTLL